MLRTILITLMLVLGACAVTSSEARRPIYIDGDVVELSRAEVMSGRYRCYEGTMLCQYWGITAECYCVDHVEIAPF